MPPIEDLKIQVDAKECLEIGSISSIVDQLVLVQSYAHSTPLDIDTILFVDQGKKALGQIFDVIGQISSPIYCVRFNSKEDIELKGTKFGDKVFCAPRSEYTSYVILSSIMNKKGSDASWKDDIEPPASKVDYSDDEQERSAKKRPPRVNQEAQFSEDQPSNSNRYATGRFYNHQYNQYPMSWHQSQNNFNYSVYDNYFQ